MLEKTNRVDQVSGVGIDMVSVTATATAPNITACITCEKDLKEHLMIYLSKKNARRGDGAGQGGDFIPVGPYFP